MQLVSAGGGDAENLEGLFWFGIRIESNLFIWACDTESRQPTSNWDASFCSTCTRTRNQPKLLDIAQPNRVTCMNLIEFNPRAAMRNKLSFNHRRGRHHQQTYSMTKHPQLEGTPYICIKTHQYAMLLLFFASPSVQHLREGVFSSIES